MKICIVTVYDSINSGSFLQARMLGTYLENMGHEVYFLERNNNAKEKYVERLHKKKFIRALLKSRFSFASKIRKRYNAFVKEQAYFKTISIEDKKTESIDCFILGSDTIWNLNVPYFLKHQDVYWGEIFKDKVTIAYACSVADTPANKIVCRDNLRDDVNRWHTISVRDKKTYDILKQMTEKNIELVCDPTLLFNKNDYIKIFDLKSEEKDKYIFLYLFQELSETQIVQLKKFAEANHLKIISGVDAQKYCDKTIVNTPKVFLQYMMGAEYVITDTFHGTVFSVIFQKKFTAVNREKSKVNFFLSQIGFENRLFQSDNAVDEKLNESLDYKTSSEKLNELIRNSKEFLEVSLKNFIN